jgi:hypothetical protein
MGLGFNMKKIVFGTALAIFLPALFFALTGCMKKPDHTPDYGQEYSVQQVNSALTKLGQAEPTTIKNGEFRYYVITQAIDQQPSSILFDIGRTVTGVREDARYVYVDYIDQIREFKPTEVVSSTEQARDKAFEKPGAVAPQLQALREQAKTIAVSSERGISRANAQEVRLTYHNLSEEAGFIPFDGITSCQGFRSSNCSCNSQNQCLATLRVLRVKFDEVVWETQDRGTKTTYDVLVSPDVPYFSQQISLCIQQWMDLVGRTVPVTQCQEVRRFNFGSTP